MSLGTVKTALSPKVFIPVTLGMIKQQEQEDVILETALALLAMREGSEDPPAITPREVFEALPKTLGVPYQNVAGVIFRNLKPVEGGILRFSV